MAIWKSNMGDRHIYRRNYFKFLCYTIYNSEMHINYLTFICDSFFRSGAGVCGAGQKRTRTDVLYLMGHLYKGGCHSTLQ
jgi:hypothetical protein